MLWSVCVCVRACACTHTCVCAPVWGTFLVSLLFSGTSIGFLGYCHSLDGLKCSWIVWIFEIVLIAIFMLRFFKKWFSSRDNKCLMIFITSIYIIIYIHTELLSVDKVWLESYYSLNSLCSGREFDNIVQLSYRFNKFEDVLEFWNFSWFLVAGNPHLGHGTSPYWCIWDMLP